MINVYRFYTIHWLFIGYHFENNISFNHDMKNNNESFLVQLWFKTW